MSLRLSLVVAMDRNGLIGKGGGLPWGRIPADMRHFRELTGNEPVIMGRKTWESIGGGVGLPGRPNIVFSNTLKPAAAPNVFIRRSIFSAVRTAGFQLGFQRGWVVGGSQIYAEFADSYWVDSAHVTVIDGEFEGDTWFPFKLFDTPEWEPVADPVELAMGVVYHKLGRAVKP